MCTKALPLFGRLDGWEVRKFPEILLEKKALCHLSLELVVHTPLARQTRIVCDQHRF